MLVSTVGQASFQTARPSGPSTIDLSNRDGLDAPVPASATAPPVPSAAISSTNSLEATPSDSPAPADTSTASETSATAADAIRSVIMDGEHNTFFPAKSNYSKK